mgnify:CR=1 FL=1
MELFIEASVVRERQPLSFTDPKIIKSLKTQQEAFLKLQSSTMLGKETLLDFIIEVCEKDSKTK